MIQLKIKHPCYAGKKYCVVYAENEKGVRYNIKHKEQDGEYSCCVCEYKENILDELNKEREKNNEPLLKNARNAAAGSIRQLDSKIAAKRNLDTFIYHLPNPLDYGITSHSEALKFMSDLGFRTNPNNRRNC